MIIKFKNRGIAVFVSMQTQQTPTIKADAFWFESEKSESEWEIEYARSAFSMYNSLLISFGDEQRRKQRESREQRPQLNIGASHGTT